MSESVKLYYLVWVRPPGSVIWTIDGHRQYWSRAQANERAHEIMAEGKYCAAVRSVGLPDEKEDDIYVEYVDDKDGLVRNAPAFEAVELEPSSESD